MNRRATRNDNDRAEWVENDQYLYSWYQSERMGLYKFVRENREAIDEHIDARCHPAGVTRGNPCFRGRI